MLSVPELRCKGSNFFPFHQIFRKKTDSSLNKISKTDKTVPKHFKNSPVALIVPLAAADGIVPKHPQTPLSHGHTAATIRPASHGHPPEAFNN